ncbi:MAG: ABC transporter permease [Chloroflexota bacterium]|nr:ABC transporter permease [Chloroflexota bacterium]
MKKWLEPLATAWVSVATHKLRSFLTILGVVIGVGAVITLMSIGKGTEATIVSRIQNLGSNLIFVQPGFFTQGGVRGFGSANTLTMEDATAIAQQVDGVSIVAPYYQSNLQVVAGSQNMRTRVTGITPDYQQALNLQTTEGDLISQFQYDRAMRVAVLGPNVKNTLFGQDDPVGQPIRIGNATFYVMAILQSKGATIMGSTDDAILIPLTAMQQAFAQPRTASGGHVVSSIIIQSTDAQYTTLVTNEITSLLQQRHNIAAGADNDFTVSSQDQLTSTLAEAMNSMTLLLGAIAAISLLVGGIGVMNIMLVSVVERTREIGIRKALGARERDIWGQFLIEAAFLTFSGGVIGIGLGWGAATLVTRSGAITTLVSPDIVLLAASVSVAIGLFFGFYPAWQASRLNPIEALRSE